MLPSNAIWTLARMAVDEDTPVFWRLIVTLAKEIVRRGQQYDYDNGSTP